MYKLIVKMKGSNEKDEPNQFRQFFLLKTVFLEHVIMQSFFRIKIQVNISKAVTKAAADQSMRDR